MLLSEEELQQFKREVNAIPAPEEPTLVTRLEVLVDELDLGAINQEIEHRTKCATRMGVEIDDLLPDGESNQLGKIFAECCRSLVEYRAQPLLGTPTTSEEQTNASTETETLPTPEEQRPEVEQTGLGDLPGSDL